jgi:hypothetical protein
VSHRQMRSLPSVAGLGWSKIRSLADEIAATEMLDEIVAAALPLRTAADPAQRQLAVHLLGFTCGQRPDNLALLREQATTDRSWQVQEAIAQAFDAYCAAIGYEAALPTIDAWLADDHANVRRAVSEGLRPWTSKKRGYFAAHPAEAVRRLAALRADPSDSTRHSAGNALRDVRRAWRELVDAETATWNLADPREAFTYRRVLQAR